MSRIPSALHEHINTAFPANVCLVATVLPDGFAQVTPRGSTMVYDDEHQLRESGLLPRGGIARFYGTAEIHRSGPVYEEVWRRLVQPEKDRDPDRKGFAVLIRIQRAEDLGGKPLDLD
jgi:hypothetical protein